MKKTIIAVVLFFALTLSMSTIFALDPGYTYEAAKLVYPVTVDGKAAAGEWDDANALVVNADNATFKEFGRWQGGAAPKTAAELSVTYKIKWDETNLYILEERTDTNYFAPTGGALAPWTGDGTLFFIAYNNGDAKWANVYEPFWAQQGADGKPQVACRAYFDGTFQALDGPDYTGNWKYASTANGNVYTMEIVIPFSDIATMGAIPAIAEGLNFYFTPVISNSDADYANWDQLNFHDRGLLPDAIVDETANPAELPKNWAGLKLTAAIVTPETAAPAATDASTPAAPAADAPQTSDAMIGFAFIMMLTCAAAVTLVKKTAKR
jgi:hypothetical protein